MGLPPRAIPAEIGERPCHQNSLYTLDIAGQPIPATAGQIIAAAREQIAYRFRRGTCLDFPRATRDYLTLKLGTREFETFCLFLDNRHRLIEFVELFRGTIDGASVHPREVVKEAVSRVHCRFNPSIFDSLALISLNLSLTHR